jgi:4-amino-4-deoxy-L-arabinose transferase-like glycosyltransferase
MARALPPMPWLFGLTSALLLVIALRPLRARTRARPLVLALVGALVAAQLLLVTQLAVPLGVALALLSLALLPNDEGRKTKDEGQPRTKNREPRTDVQTQDIESPPTPHTPYPIPHTPYLSRRVELAALALILLAALALRFYRLDELPYGLWRDEGRHGLEALHMLADPSYRPAYIPGGVDLPGLGLMPFALALRVWGIHVWSLRTITALAGALAVLPLYGLTLRLYGRGAVALLAAGLLAVSSWSITISRFSFPTIFDPLLQLTALWLLVVGLEQAPKTKNGHPQGQPRTEQTSEVARWHSARRFTRYAALLLAGVCLGLAAQTYHTGRLGPAIAGLLVLLLLGRAPQRWRAWLLGMATLAVGFVLAVSPLLTYAVSNPAAFNSRVGAVFLLSDESSDKRAPLFKLDESLGRHLLMFNVRGDANGRHAPPNRPMLDAVAGLGLLAGIAALLRRRRDWRSAFLLGALALGLLPSLLAVDSPHAMRAIDALPFACIIAAIGLVQLWQIGVADNSTIPGSVPNRLSFMVRRSSFVVLVLSSALALNAWTYFAIMPNDRDVWTAFYPLHTRVGEYVRGLADTQGPEAVRQVYVAERLTDNPVFGYLTYGLPVQSFGARLSAPAAPGALFVVQSSFAQAELRELIARNGLDPTPVLRGPLLPDGSLPAFVVYRKQ